jgi:hypothetical protein
MTEEADRDVIKDFLEEEQRALRIRRSILGPSRESLDAAERAFPGPLMRSRSAHRDDLRRAIEAHVASVITRFTGKRPT